MVQIQIVTDANLSVFTTVFQAVFEGFKRGTGNINRRAINLISREAEANFGASIIRDETSVTAGGTAYRTRSRVTGRFTFGPGKTFTGSLLKNQGPTITGFGYPIVARADARTKKVWRGLEFGWESMRMPRGIWRDNNGSRVRQGRASGPGGTYQQFFPTGGGAVEEVSGIEAKLFITEAFESVVTNYVTPEYQRLAEEVAKRATAKAR